MSLVSKAEVALVNSLQKSRSGFRPPGSKQRSSSNVTGGGGETQTQAGIGSSTIGGTANSPPPIPAALSEEAEELRNVLTLEVPRFDKSKTFESLEKQKISKKDRHMSTLDGYSQFLDNLSEDVEQKVLALSRDIRGQLEIVDASLQQWYKTLVDDVFLVKNSEQEVSVLRQDIENILSDRNNALDRFADDLEHLEVDRANVVSTEIKKLLDKLISIAFQLPNEIEYTIETEAFELNAVVTSNRKTHAALLGIMRTTQVEVEVEAIHRWEACKMRWRVLRHEQALAQYHEHMKSKQFTDPQDRQQFLADFRAGQLARHAERSDQLGKLAALNAENINSDIVQKVQESLSALSEQESVCMQQCYDGLTSLRSNLQYSAERRREELRLELHSYGALQDEPPLSILAEEMREALADESLSELWRLGGGLKPEFQALSVDMTTNEIVYDTHMQQIRSKLEGIVCSFELKAIMEERGRLMRLDPVRGMITKMKSVPRKDVIGVIRDLMPDLEEIIAVEKLSPVFRRIVEECMTDMQREIARVEEYIATMGENSSASSRTGTAKSLKSAVTTVRNVTAISRASSRGGSKSRMGGMTGGSSSAGGMIDYELEKNTTIDPLSVKHWARQLGILYYGPNLPDTYQATCTAALDGSMKQIECNAKVDDVIATECQHVMSRIDNKYKTLIDQLATYLETQVSTLNTSCSNMAGLYMTLARETEAHRAAQISIDDQAADSLFDYAEDYRLHREDLEMAYEEACKTLRRSADYDTLTASFETVLTSLLAIQNSYRIYHEKACYFADMHPLNLANEFKTQLETICGVFDLKPVPPHPILHGQARILKSVKRFNKKYYKDPTSAPPPTSGSSDTAEEGVVARGETNDPAVSTIDPSSTELSNDADDADIHTATTATKEDEEASFPGGMYISPLFENPEEIITKGAVVGSSSTKIGGKYGLNVSVQDYVAALFEDPVVIEERRKRMVEIKAEEEAERADILKANNAVGAEEVSVDAPMSPRTEPPVVATGKKGKGPSAAEVAAQKAAQEAAEVAAELEKAKNAVVVMDSFPWILAAGASALGDCPFPTDDEWQCLDQPDKEEREDAIAQYMIHIKGGAMHPMIAADPDGLGVIYANCVAARARSIERRRYANDPEFVLRNVPLDVHGSPWLENVEVFQDGVVKVMVCIRNSLITHLENEAYYKTVTMEDLNKARKATLTEELEDRLRTHWPRRGRVETQLKQPREAELLAHQEKTWRIVQSIQEKMLNLLNRFEGSLASGHEDIDRYTAEMAGYKETLESTTYKTLAALSCMDVKGRSAFLGFQSACTDHLSGLNVITSEDIEAIIENAQEFRKLCPMQKMGSDGVPTSGYSETEIGHIQMLVDGQEQEIRELATEWKERVLELQREQIEAMKVQEEYTSTYATVAQDLALSEGLGQRYGAPRRRAQERLRTEVARDEQSAGKVDELLAKLQFALSENTRKFDRVVGSGPETDVYGGTRGQEEVDDRSSGDNGRHDFDNINYTWEIVNALRRSLDMRAAYLQVYPNNEGPDMTPIGWIRPNGIPSPSQVGGDADVEEGGTGSSDGGNTGASVPAVVAMNFSDVVAEAEADCKKETVQLYDSESRGDMIKDLPNGVPESLTQWLEETRHKLLGAGGHREKAWKRLWGQVDTMDSLLARKPGPMESPEPRLGVPGMSLKGLQHAFAQYVRNERESREVVFSRTVSVLEKCRDKHDRLLRPRLGSPDAVGELNKLDSTEEQRSNDLNQVVVKFRSGLLKHIGTIAKELVDTIALASTSYISILDNTVRLDVLEIPPDTEVPKKRMTLKKLRKAERIKDSVAGGAEDLSKSRIWAGIDGTKIARVMRSIDDLILSEDRDGPTEGEAAAVAPPVASPAKAKATKGAAVETIAAVPDEANPTSIVTDKWLREVCEKSSKRGLVSSAHRLLISERDAAIDIYFGTLDEMFHEIRTSYDAILQQESSWTERWKRQVELLRKGV